MFVPKNNLFDRLVDFKQRYETNGISCDPVVNRLIQLNAPKVVEQVISESVPVKTSTPIKPNYCRIDSNVSVLQENRLDNQMKDRQSAPDSPIFTTKKRRTVRIEDSDEELDKTGAHYYSSHPLLRVYRL